MTAVYLRFNLIILISIAMPIALMPPSTLSAASATNNTATSTIIPRSVSDIGSSQLTKSIQNDSSIDCCIPVLLAPIATSGNNLYVAWSSNDTGHFEILFRSSIDNGQTFTDKINLSNSPAVDSIDPQIAASDNHVYVSWWEDYGGGRREPFFIVSNDNGHTFGSPLQLSTVGPIAMDNNNNTNRDY